MAPDHGHLGGDPPGSLTLLRIAQEHRPALEYDWRARFGLMFDPGGTTSWGESIRLCQVLLGDSTSQVAASVAGWAYPASREHLALADLYDVTVRANSKRHAKVNAYPRPWDKPKATTWGRTRLSQRVINAAMALRGHYPPQDG